MLDTAVWRLGGGRMAFLVTGRPFKICDASVQLALKQVKFSLISETSYESFSTIVS